MRKINLDTSIYPVVLPNEPKEPGITVLEYFVGEGLAGGMGPADAVSRAQAAIKLLNEIYEKVPHGVTRL